MASWRSTYLHLFRSLASTLTRESERRARGVVEEMEIKNVVTLLRNTSKFPGQVSFSQPSALQVATGKQVADAYLDSAFKFANQHDQLVASVKAVLHFLDGDVHDSHDAKGSSSPWIAQYPDHEILKSRFAYRDLFVSDSLLVGINLLVPHTEYEAHKHAAKELYLPLVLHGPNVDGSSNERQMDRRYLVHAHYDRFNVDDLTGSLRKTKQTSDESLDADHDTHGFVLFHDQNQPHGMKSTHYPLLNIWIQYGTNLRTDRTEFIK